jgi:hypothetical protein
MGSMGGSGNLQRVVVLLAAALTVAGSLSMAIAGNAVAVGPSIDLAKSASTATAAPGEDFIWFLTYSCTSLLETCDNATVTDTLPSEVSRAATDVNFSGNFADVSYDPASGTATFVLFSPLPPGTTGQIGISARFAAGTPPGTTALNVATMTADLAAPAQSNPSWVTATDSPPLQVVVPWSAAEGARLSSMAAHLGTTPEQLQHDSVALVAFLVGLSGDRTPTPWAPTPRGADVTVTSSWSSADVPVLRDVEAKYVVGSLDAHRLGVYFVSFLLGLGGH